MAEAKGIEKGIAVGLEKGIAVGLEKGRMEGRLEEKREMVRLLKQEGMPVDSICKVTGLSSEEVEAL